MKKNLFKVAAVAFMALVSCNKELDQLDNTPIDGQITFTAFADASDETKTTLNGKQSLWSKGDRIWILNGTKNDTGWKKAYATSDNLTGKAIFTPEKSSPALSGDNYFAIYPAGAADNATWDGKGDLTGVVLTPYQKATATQYDPAAHLAVAKSSTTNLEFKNAVSLVKFSVARNDVKSVTLYAKGVSISGSCNISANGKVTAWTGAGETNDWVELKPANNGTFEANREYYIAIFPTTLKGFSIQFSTGSEKFDAMTTTKSVTLARNQILNLGSLDYVAPKTVSKVYLKPGKWNVGNSTFFLYLYNPTGANTSVKMSDSDSDGIFEATIPEGYPKATLCRMPKGSTQIDWNKKQNQIEHIEIPLSGNNNVYYTISDWDSGAWNAQPSTKTLYFKPDFWNTGNAYFVAYSWKDGGSNGFKELTKITDEVFSCEIAKDHNKVIVLRKSNKNLSWDGEWNRTGDVTLKDGVKCLKITGWDNSYSWSDTL